MMLCILGGFVLLPKLSGDDSRPGGSFEEEQMYKLF